MVGHVVGDAGATALVPVLREPPCYVAGVNQSWEDIPQCWHCMFQGLCGPGAWQSQGPRGQCVIGCSEAQVVANEGGWPGWGHARLCRPVDFFPRTVGTDLRQGTRDVPLHI